MKVKNLIRGTMIAIQLAMGSEGTLAGKVNANLNPAKDVLYFEAVLVEDEKTIIIARSTSNYWKGVK